MQEWTINILGISELKWIGMGEFNTDDHCIIIYTDDNTPIAEREEELKSLLMKVKEKSEKAGLKLSIQ